jgi:NitT/TauT family transport system substrate-binding protein
MKKRATIYILFWLIPVLIFAAGSGETRLTIAYPQSVSSVPMMELIERYPDDYVGTAYSDHPQALGQLINGEIDVLVSGFSVGLTRYVAAGDVGLLESYVWGASSIMTAEPMESLSNLTGETLYIPFEGSPIDIQVKAQLEALGLTGSVEIAYAPFPQAAAQLAQGRAGAAVLVEPLASKLEADGTAYRLMTIQDSYAVISGGEPRSPQVAVFVLGPFFGENRRELRRLVNRMEEIGEEMENDQAGFAGIYHERFSQRESVIMSALDNTLFDFLPPDRDRELIEEYASLMGLPVPSDDFFLD